ncbi:MAG: hypothetical protein Q7S84_03255 [bacterium]|nr:hypothetical protein [bacterium]
MEAQRKEREHVRVLKLLSERIIQGEYQEPVRGIIRNCVAVARVFVMRKRRGMRLQHDGNHQCTSITLRGERGEPIFVGIDCDYTVKVGRDGAGKAIFFTNLE